MAAANALSYEATMSTMNGICLISIPKSGTMFLSRYLERVTGAPVIFGLKGANHSSLQHDLASGWNQEIFDKRNLNCPDIEVMTRRFAMMLTRNRTALSHIDRSRIISDHGLSSFLRFLISPSNLDIQHPGDIVSWARSQRLAPIFLYRDIRDVSNSLAHFLVSGKSFLVNIESLSSAADLVVRLYAPVLAEEMRQWKQEAAAHDVLCVSYETLMANPEHWIEEICRRGNLVYAPEGVANAPDSYRSWTYRADKTAWLKTFTDEQQSILNTLAKIVGTIEL